MQKRTRLERKKALRETGDDRDRAVGGGPRIRAERTSDVAGAGGRGVAMGRRVESRVFAAVGAFSLLIYLSFLSPPFSLIPSSSSSTAPPPAPGPTETCPFLPRLVPVLAGG